MEVPEIKCKPLIHDHHSLTAKHRFPEDERYGIIAKRTLIE